MDNKLQNIKDEVAKGLGYPHWNELLHWEAHNHYLGLTLEKAIDQVAIRYAQTQTQALTKQYEDLELCNILLKDQVDHLQNDLGYRKILLEQLIDQKRELVEMLVKCEKVISELGIATDDIIELIKQATEG